MKYQVTGLTFEEAKFIAEWLAGGSIVPKPDAPIALASVIWDRGVTFPNNEAKIERQVSP